VQHWNKKGDEVEKKIVCWMMVICGWSLGYAAQEVSNRTLWEGMRDGGLISQEEYQEVLKTGHLSIGNDSASKIRSSKTRPSKKVSSSESTFTSQSVSSALSASTEMSASQMMMMGDPPEESMRMTNDTSPGSSEITVYVPDGFNDRVEIYTTTNLLDEIWSIAVQHLWPTHLTPSSWTHVNPPPTCFYQAGNQDLDSDLDGLNDFYEKRISYTDPDDADSDDDGMSDGQEVLLGSNPNDPNDTAILPPKLLFSFENHPRSPVTDGFDDDWYGGVFFVEEHATHEDKAMLLTHGIAVTETNMDWTGYDYMMADVYLDHPEELDVTLEVRDGQSTDWYSRKDKTIRLYPGPNTLLLPTELWVNDGSRTLNVSNVVKFLFTIIPEVANLYFDHIRPELTN